MFSLASLNLAVHCGCEVSTLRLRLVAERERSPSVESMMSGKIVRGAIRVVLMAVAMGILMMWIVMPTNAYRKHWLLGIREEVNNSTYIGTQGWFVSRPS